MTADSKHPQIVIRAGIIAIVTNFALTILKIVISILSGSVAILSDALHGLVDTLSGIVVIASELIKPQKTTHRKPKTKFSEFRARLTHSDIERIGARAIALIILLVAVHIFIESIAALLHPEDLDLGAPALIILAVAMLAKISLAIFLQKTGQRVHSATLRASGVESFNDSIVSAAVLFSALIYTLWQVNIEAYISLIIAFIIFKSGLDIIFPRKKP